MKDPKIIKNSRAQLALKTALPLDVDIQDRSKRDNNWKPNHYRYWVRVRTEAETDVVTVGGTIEMGKLVLWEVVYKTSDLDDAKRFRKERC